MSIIEYITSICFAYGGHPRIVDLFYDTIPGQIGWGSQRECSAFLVCRLLLVVPSSLHVEQDNRYIAGP